MLLTWTLLALIPTAVNFVSIFLYSSYSSLFTRSQDFTAKTLHELSISMDMLMETPANKKRPSKFKLNPDITISTWYYLNYRHTKQNHVVTTTCVFAAIMSSSASLSVFLKFKIGKEEFLWACKQSAYILDVNQMEKADTSITIYFLFWGRDKLTERTISSILFLSVQR